jgi:ATP-dependent Lhr-like helicase
VPRCVARRQHILVTTPESLYLLLTSGSGREMLSTVRTVIVDEIHAVAQSKRGAHLTLTLARLAANATQPIQRIGLSRRRSPSRKSPSSWSGNGEVVPGCE